jgi:hypothetical protein
MRGHRRLHHDGAAGHPGRRWGRSAGSLIQTMGRAARYVEGHAILYADVAANPALDFDYARQWAARLRVEDLLARALAESEP